ncbi:MAG: hypothetical protein ACFE9T_14410 [Promethearchaeota archaeon]
MVSISSLSVKDGLAGIVDTLYLKEKGRKPQQVQKEKQQEELLENVLSRWKDKLDFEIGKISITKSLIILSF